MRTINMMISETYVPNWGAKEALRELVSNAMDADPDYILSFAGGRVSIRTSTSPTLTDMVLLGAGSKSKDSQTIGQFGEGLKLAALALTRLGADLEILTPLGLMTFDLQEVEGLSLRTLHATLSQTTQSDDIEDCRIRFPSEGLELDSSQFLPTELRSKVGPLEKSAQTGGFALYCKGIKIADREEPAIFDWNLENLGLNRDRNVVDMWHTQAEIARLLTPLILSDSAIADTVIDNPESIEAKCWSCIFLPAQVATAFASAFRRKFGERAVLATNPKSDKSATLRQFDTVALGAFSDTVAAGGIKRSEAVVTVSDGLVEVSGLPYQKEIAELENLLDIIGCGATTIRVFAEHEEILGSFSSKTGVWLNEKLFQPGERFERIRTMLHEMGHSRGGGDASPEFEASLDFIAAKLAERLLAS